MNCCRWIADLLVIPILVSAAESLLLVLQEDLERASAEIAELRSRMEAAGDLQVGGALGKFKSNLKSGELCAVEAPGCWVIQPACDPHCRLHSNPHLRCLAGGECYSELGFSDAAC